MPRLVRCGLIQVHCDWSPEKYLLPDIKKKMIAKHEALIAAAAKKKVQILGLQELFTGLNFAANRELRCSDLTKGFPKAPTSPLMKNSPKNNKWCPTV